jgi:DNA-binding winged helix-turn-helix (wHTH) protein/tetratricopeptide (TPR) repeat protein
MANGIRQFYEFGPYRIDPDHRRLTRETKPIPLQPKAFDILLVLVQNSEKVVPKDDLMKAVWPGTFVEESNLAQNVSVLRKTLGDAVGENRYIVTVPGRGYRFAGKVQVVDDEEIVTDEEDKLIVESYTRSRLVVDEQQVPAKALTATSRSLRWLVLGGSLLCALVATGAYLYTHRAPKLTERDTVVLADFDNRTGDPVFDGTLRLGLSAQLEQSPFLNLLSDQGVRQTLALMAQPKDARLTLETAREVCQRTASTAVLGGSIAQIGTRYLLTLKAIDCSTGDSLASTEAEARDKNHVLDALGKIASEIRSKLGESLTSVQKYDALPEKVTTPSLEALKAYNLAHQAQVSNLPIDSVPLYERAINLDPNFAMAYLGLGITDFNLGETSHAAENVQKAYQLRASLSEREKLGIELIYDALVTGDFEAALKSDLACTHIYPRDSRVLTNLADFYTYFGEYEKSLAAAQEALSFNSGTAQNYSDLVIHYLHVNRLDEAKAAALEAKSHNVDSPAIHASLYLVEFLQHDAAGMEREAAEVMGRPGSEDLVLDYESDTAAYGGHFVQARELTRRAADSTSRSGQKETAAEYQAEAAVREALVGNLALASRQAKEALALSNGRDVTAIAALALALAGDSADSNRMADDLGKRFPQDTVVRYNSLPAIRGAMALRNRDYGKAISALAASTPYELGQTTQEVTFVLYPIYLRGEAYLAAREGTAAAAEFQKILDHPGLVQNEPIGALAHLELGRAYVFSGDTSKAHAAYQEFFALWKDADPNIPILNQARAEYAKLQ